MTINYTTNFGFEKPDYLTDPWAAPVNRNWDAIDTAISRSIIAGQLRTWANNTDYTAGDVLLDIATVPVSYWYCNVTHTSAAAGTFAADRAANPTYWTSFFNGNFDHIVINPVAATTVFEVTGSVAVDRGIDWGNTAFTSKEYESLNFSIDGVTGIAAVRRGDLQIGTYDPADGTRRGINIFGADGGAGAGSNVAGTNGLNTCWALGNISSYLGGAYNATLGMLAAAGIVLMTNGATVAGGIDTSQRWFMGASDAVIAASNQSKVTISLNTVAAPMTAGMFASPALQIVGANTLSTHVVVSTHGNATSKLWLIQSRGNLGANTATLSADHVGAVVFAGYDTTNGYTQGAAILGYAAENYAVGAKGMELRFYTTEVGTVTFAPFQTFGSNYVLLGTAGTRATTQPAMFTVNKNTGTVPSSASNWGNAVAHFHGLDNNNCQIVYSTIGAGFQGHVFAASRGTTGAQTAIQTNDFVGSVFAYGYHTAASAAYAAGAGLAFIATDNWTSTTKGMRIDVQATGAGTASLVVAISFGAGVMVGSSLVDPGQGAYRGTAGMQIYANTAVPAGGTAGVGYKFSSTANLGVFFGSGAPTLSAAQGSLYVRTDGSSTTTRLYVNTNGTTGWTNVTTAT